MGADCDPLEWLDCVDAEHLSAWILHCLRAWIDQRTALKSTGYIWKKRVETHLHKSQQGQLTSKLLIPIK